MPEIDVLPDAELVAVQWLRTVTAVTALSDRIYTQFPDDDPVWPLVTVSRIGGLPVVRQRLDAASLQVDCWGNPADVEGRPDASLLARTVRAALHQMPGQDITSGWVTGVEDSDPLAYRPDDSRDPAIPRYSFGVTVYLHTRSQ